MKIDASFDSAFLQLQNGVNNATRAANQVLKAVDSDSIKKIEVAADNKAADRNGRAGLNVSA